MSEIIETWTEICEVCGEKFQATWDIGLSTCSEKCEAELDALLMITEVEAFLNE